MKLKCLGCEALARLIYSCAAQSPHVVDVELFKLGLHNQPKGLRARLQERIDAIPADEYDAIVMVYGVCGKATIGLTAKNLPVVIPRAHDCITLFLGDRARYKDQFDDKPGTYWYAIDYMERHEPGTALGADSASTDLTAVYDEYVEKYRQGQCRLSDGSDGRLAEPLPARRLHRHGRGRRRRPGEQGAATWPSSVAGCLSV